jgi:hypothetical protein
LFGGRSALSAITTSSSVVPRYLPRVQRISRSGVLPNTPLRASNSSVIDCPLHSQQKHVGLLQNGSQKRLAGAHPRRRVSPPGLSPRHHLLPLPFPPLSNPRKLPQSHRQTPQKHLITMSKAMKKLVFSILLFCINFVIIILS